MVPGDKQFAKSVEPGTRAPSDAVEEELLPILGSAENGALPEIQGSFVEARPIYPAASGRRCRHFTIAGNNARTIVACEMNEGWKLVPEVFVAPTPETPQETPAASAKK